MSTSWSIRKASGKDCKAIYDIRNHELITKVSINPQVIPYSEHVAWFESTLINPMRRLFVIEENEQIMAVLRFDLTQECTEAKVSIYVAPSHWGKGLGSFLLTMGENQLKAEVSSLRTLKAEVLINNEASLKLFAKCGFKKEWITFSKEVL